MLAAQVRDRAYESVRCYGELASAHCHQSESGLNQNINRDYDPLAGSYIESDPIGLKGGITTYTYVGDDPVVNIDAFGLCDAPDCKKAADDCHDECEHKLGKGGRTNQGFPYANCFKNCMSRKGCRDQIDTLPEFQLGHAPYNPRQQPATPTPTPWWVLIFALPWPGNPIYGGA